MRYQRGAWSYGPIAGCLFAIGAVVVAAAIGGLAITAAAWPFVVFPDWPLWLRIAAEIGYIPAAVVILGLLVYLASGRRTAAPRPARHRGGNRDAPGPRDWSPADPMDLGAAQDAPKHI